MIMIMMIMIIMIIMNLTYMTWSITEMPGSQVLKIRLDVTLLPPPNLAAKTQQHQRAAAW